MTQIPELMLEEKKGASCDRTSIGGMKKNQKANGPHTAQIQTVFDGQ